MDWAMVAFKALDLAMLWARANSAESVGRLEHLRDRLRQRRAAGQQPTAEDFGEIEAELAGYRARLEAALAAARAREGGPG